jgi:hypothetical protein
LNAVRALGITVPMKARIPSSRIASLARFANRAKAQAISRMPTARRIATLVAFVHCLEATAQDEVLEVLEMLLDDLFGKAITADKKARLPFDCRSSSRTFVGDGQRAPRRDFSVHVADSVHWNSVKDKRWDERGLNGFHRGSVICRLSPPG